MKANDVRAYLEGIVRGAFGHIWLGSTKGGISGGLGTSGAIGVFHAGVEAGWWEGLTRCAAGGAMSLDDLLAAPIVRCDQVQWELLGISMAGWNAILSLGGALTVALLLGKRR